MSIEDIQGIVDTDGTRSDPRDWIAEKDIDTESGPEAVQYLRCPECGGIGSETRDHRYECEECGHESYVIQQDQRY